MRKRAEREEATGGGGTEEGEEEEAAAAVVSWRGGCDAGELLKMETRLALSRCLYVIWAGGMAVEAEWTGAADAGAEESGAGGAAGGRVGEMVFEICFVV